MLAESGTPTGIAVALAGVTVIGGDSDYSIHSLHSEALRLPEAVGSKLQC